MKQITNKDKLIGKVIERVVIDSLADKFALFFSDQSFAVFYYDDECYSQEFLYPQNLDHYDKYNLGIITKEEYEQYKKQRQIDMILQREKKERQTYEELKKKYENK